MGMGRGEWELDTLILPNRPPKHDAFAGVSAALFQKPPAVADALRGDQDPFGVESIQQRTKSLALLTDEVLHRNVQAIEEHLAGVVVQHGAQRSNL